jgi:hypothetical protein
MIISEHYKTEKIIAKTPCNVVRQIKRLEKNKWHVA